MPVSHADSEFSPPQQADIVGMVSERQCLFARYAKPLCHGFRSLCFIGLCRSKMRVPRPVDRGRAGNGMDGGTEGVSPGLRQ